LQITRLLTFKVGYRVSSRNKAMVVKAVSQVQRAVDFMFDVQFSEIISSKLVLKYQFAI